MAISEVQPRQEQKSTDQKNGGRNPDAWHGIASVHRRDEQVAAEANHEGHDGWTRTTRAVEDRVDAGVQPGHFQSAFSNVTRANVTV
jgi:hypothetical protein